MDDLEHIDPRPQAMAMIAPPKLNTSPTSSYRLCVVVGCLLLLSSLACSRGEDKPTPAERAPAAREQAPGERTMAVPKKEAEESGGELLEELAHLEELELDASKLVAAARREDPRRLEGASGELRKSRQMEPAWRPRYATVWATGRHRAYKKLFEASAGAHKGPLREATLVCHLKAMQPQRATRGGIRRLFGKDRPDLGAHINFGDRPVAFRSGRDDHGDDYVVVSFVSMKPGDAIKIALYDRDVTSSDLLGELEADYTGALPMELKSSSVQARCRLADQAATKQQRGVIAAELDRSIRSLLARPTIKPQKMSQGFPHHALTTARSLATTLAELEGWHSPTLRKSIARIAAAGPLWQKALARHAKAQAKKSPSGTETLRGGKLSLQPVDGGKLRCGDAIDAKILKHRRGFGHRDQDTLCHLRLELTAKKSTKLSNFGSHSFKGETVLTRENTAVFEDGVVQHAELIVHHLDGRKVFEGKTRKYTLDAGKKLHLDLLITPKPRRANPRLRPLPFVHESSRGAPALLQFRYVPRRDQRAVLELALRGG